MNHFLKCLSRLVFVFGLVAECVHADPKPTDIALEIAPEVLMARVLDQVETAFDRYGNDYLQNLLRFYAEQRIDLNVLRRQVLISNYGRPKVFLVPAAPLEIEAANKVLSESGFDFIQFDYGAVEVDPPTPSTEVIQSRRHWIDPVIVFATALTVGMIQVYIQQSRAADAGQPVGDFVAQLRPFLVMGQVGALWTWQFGIFQNWWNEHFWAPRTTPWRPAFTWESIRDLTGRLIRPRGHYAEVIRDAVTPLLLTFSAASAAAYPGNPVVYDGPSALKLILVSSLYVVAYGASKFALQIFQSQGSIGPSQEVVIESVIRRASRVSMIASLAPSTGLVGQWAQGLISIFSSARLWFKLQVGDPLYRRRTANMMDPDSFPMTGAERFCARMAEKLGLGFRFKKQAGPQAQSGARSSF